MQRGSWLEAIALFQSLRDADHGVAARLLRMSSDAKAVVLNLLRMLGVYLSGEEPDKLDRFIAASHRAGPPLAVARRFRRSSEPPPVLRQPLI